MPILSVLFRKLTWKAFVAAAGLTAGVVAIILAQRELEEEQAAAPARTKASSKPAAKNPPKPTQIEPDPEPEAEAPPVVESLALSLKARPATFKRGKVGTIIAQTTPGAACTLEAKYSTNRRPTGLDKEAVIATGDGVAEWEWKVSTGGNYVDVTVKASMPGLEVLEKSKRVKVTD